LGRYRLDKIVARPPPPLENGVKSFGRIARDFLFRAEKNQIRDQLYTREHLNAFADFPYRWLIAFNAI